MKALPTYLAPASASAIATNSTKTGGSSPTRSTSPLIAASPPPFLRSAAPPPDSSALVTHLLEMLRRGPARTQALIQTLAVHGNTDLLGAALKAEPSLLCTETLLDLADNRLGKEFANALSLRPDLIDGKLVLGLCGGKSEPRYLSVVLRSRPELRDTRTEAGSGLDQVITESQGDTRLRRLKLDLVQAPE